MYRWTGGKKHTSKVKNIIQQSSHANQRAFWSHVNANSDSEETQQDGADDSLMVEYGRGCSREEADSRSEIMPFRILPSPQSETTSLFPNRCLQTQQLAPQHVSPHKSKKCRRSFKNVTSVGLGARRVLSASATRNPRLGDSPRRSPKRAAPNLPRNLSSVLKRRKVSPEIDSQECHHPKEQPVSPPPLHESEWNPNFFREIKEWFPPLERAREARPRYESLPPHRNCPKSLTAPSLHCDSPSPTESRSHTLIQFESTPTAPKERIRFWSNGTEITNLIENEYPE
mmetsp:Transcript_8403/g.31106  ORF Transcript_8403/g.31106 Transcript_8403/m.31106 type:complete len:285 (+) Transcript_8403:4613-5467(+)